MTRRTLAERLEIAQQRRLARTRTRVKCKQCSVPGCQVTKVLACGMCASHYQTMRNLRALLTDIRKPETSLFVCRSCQIELTSAHDLARLDYLGNCVECQKKQVDDVRLFIVYKALARLHRLETNQPDQEGAGPIVPPCGILE